MLIALLVTLATRQAAQFVAARSGASKAAQTAEQLALEHASTEPARGEEGKVLFNLWLEEAQGRLPAPGLSMVEVPAKSVHAARKWLKERSPTLRLTSA